MKLTLNRITSTSLHHTKHLLDESSRGAASSHGGGSSCGAVSSHGGNSSRGAVSSHGGDSSRGAASSQGGDSSSSDNSQPPRPLAGQGRFAGKRLPGQRQVSKQVPV